jgi:hypothetical protein
MSTFDVLEDRGTAALLKVFGAVALFLTLHLIRIPLVLIAAVLEGIMRRVDGYATRAATTAPVRPINQFFVPPQPNQYATPAPYSAGRRTP